MSTLFISYAQADRTRAKPIAKFLEASGYKVWWDVGLRPGENFTTEIQQQIQKADHVIVIWSRLSVDSFWVTAEVTYARSCKKPILPLRIDDCMPPVPFNLLQTMALASLESDGPDIVEALAKSGTLPIHPTKENDAGDLPLMETIARRAQELARWEFIKSSNDAEDFRSFLQRFPDGDLADLAMLRLESLRWEELRHSRTREALLSFLKEFPDGVKSPEARRLLQRQDRALEQAHWSKLRGGLINWAHRRSHRILPEYEAFLRQHPNGAHSAQAQSMVDRMRREMELWHQAEKTCDRSLVVQYLSEYPTGEFVSQAKAHLSRLKHIQGEERSNGSETEGSRGSFPYRTFGILLLISFALGCISAWLGLRGHFLINLPQRSLAGNVFYLVHPYPIFIGLFVVMLIHVWGNRSWATTVFAFFAVLSFRYLSQYLGLISENDAIGILKAMIVGALYCFGAWVAGFTVAPYMRQSTSVFFVAIGLGALTYPNWFKVLGLGIDNNEIITAGIFFVACTMPIAYSLLRVPTRAPKQEIGPIRCT